jgi:gentisate 1,2-dioxygenase
MAQTSGHEATNGMETVEQMLEKAKEANTLPLWTQMALLNPPEPNPTAIPFIWKYQTIRPCLLKAGELVTEKQAERRVLMLINPARGTCDSVIFLTVPC